MIRRFRRGCCDGREVVSGGVRTHPACFHAPKVVRRCFFLLFGSGSHPVLVRCPHFFRQGHPVWLACPRRQSRLGGVAAPRRRLQLPTDAPARAVGAADGARHQYRRPRPFPPAPHRQSTGALCTTAPDSAGPTPCATVGRRSAAAPRGAPAGRRAGRRGRPAPAAGHSVQQHLPLVRRRAATGAPAPSGHRRASGRRGRRRAPPRARGCPPRGGRRPWRAAHRPAGRASISTPGRLGGARIVCRARP